MTYQDYLDRNGEALASPVLRLQRTWPEQLMCGLIDEVANDPDDRREFVRAWIYRSALLSIPGQITAQPCSVRDLTVKGASIRLNGITLLPLELQISFDEFRTCERCRLIWRDGDFAGLLFQSRQHRF